MAGIDDRTVKEAEVHFRMVTAIPPSKMKLTQQDPEIYEQFRKLFPTFNVERINEKNLKNHESWKQLSSYFEGKVKDVERSCLLRKDATREFGNQNMTLVTRIQFLAIEIARNKEEVNDTIFSIYQKMKNAGPSSGGCCSRC